MCDHENMRELVTFGNQDYVYYWSYNTKLHVGNNNKLYLSHRICYATLLLASAKGFNP